MLKRANFKNLKFVNFLLTTADVPGQPQGPMEISDVTGSSMTLAWQAPRHDGGKPITQYIVDKKEETAKNWSEVSKVSSPSLHLSRVI